MWIFGEKKNQIKIYIPIEEQPQTTTKEPDSHRIITVMKTAEEMEKKLGRYLATASKLKTC